MELGPFEYFDLQKHMCGKCAKEVIEQSSLIQLNAQDGKGETALIKAIKTKRNEIAQILIANGVDVNIQDKEGRTALHWAVDNPVPEVYYNMLIQQTATDIDITDNSGRAPFEYLLENKITSYLKSIGVWPQEDNFSDAEHYHEFTQLYQNVVKQLFEIQKNHDMIFVQPSNYDIYQDEHEIIADIISIIKATYPFTKIIQMNAAMMKIQQSVQNFFQKLSPRVEESPEFSDEMSPEIDGHLTRDQFPNVMLAHLKEIESDNRQSAFGQ